MEFTIEFEREADGRWIAEIPSLPGTMAYGTTPEQARAHAQALALRVVAESSVTVPGAGNPLPEEAR